MNVSSAISRGGEPLTPRARRVGAAPFPPLQPGANRWVLGYEQLVQTFSCSLLEGRDQAGLRYGQKQVRQSCLQASEGLCLAQSP